MTRLTAQGATGQALSAGCATPSLMVCIQSPSSALVRRFGAGKLPTTPALQQATTSSGDETRNIGAAKIGMRKLES
ncbi:hypothetical protein OEG86_09850 [Hoeflea alexandrii]|nr:hypothetical protein [Hoeflea alexandrii]MCY0152482.1 hypothetical protein [Hoeflea alexandrii]